MKVNFIKTIQMMIVLLGMMLLVINSVNFFTESKTHVSIENTQNHKTNLNFENRQKAILHLKEFEFDGLEERELIKLNKYFAESIVHFWPSYNYISIYENWIIYLFQQTEHLMKFKNPIFGSHERLGWQKVLESGFGLCSQASIALYDYLVEKNQKAKIVGLHGHVVVELMGDKTNFIMDPDYNVVFAANFEDLPNMKNIIQNAYREKGYSKELVRNIVEIYITGENNSSGSLWEYYPKYLLFYYIMEILKWLLPSVTIIYYAFRIQRNSFKGYK